MSAFRKIATGTLQKAVSTTLTVNVVPEVTYVAPNFVESPQIMQALLVDSNDQTISGVPVEIGQLVLIGNSKFGTISNTGVSVFDGEITFTGRNADKYSFDNDGNLIYTY